MINELYNNRITRDTRKYQCLILEPNYKLPYDKTHNDLVTESLGSSNVFTKVYIYMQDKAYTRSEGLIVTNSTVASRFKPGDSHTISGRIYNISDIPVIAYFHKGLFGPAKVTNAITKYDNNIKVPIPLFKISPLSDAKVLTPEKAKYFLGLERLHRHRKSYSNSLFDFKNMYGLQYQEEFSELQQVLNYPVIQIINGTGVIDDISETLLNYLTDDNWKQILNVTSVDKQYHKGPQIVYLKDDSEAYLQLPTVKMLAI